MSPIRHHLLYFHDLLYAAGAWKGVLIRNGSSAATVPGPRHTFGGVTTLHPFKMLTIIVCVTHCYFTMNMTGHLLSASLSLRAFSPVVLGDAIKGGSSEAVLLYFAARYQVAPSLPLSHHFFTLTTSRCCLEKTKS